MSETLIKVDNVSKKFCRSLKKSLWYGMQDLGRELAGRPHGGNGQLRPDEFWAVKDVSFEVKRGECLGLIGRNGAGKTTLLKMLNGLIKPDAGRIEIRGRVGALIALGAGFNPILTGRENIYANASILGLKKSEIDTKLEEIVDFAELEEFIDSPVRNYSSGMVVRLGFSIATALDPDILILDEVLAVGDTSFRLKCLNRLGELMKSGVAALMVTHQFSNLERHAHRAMILERGGLGFSGSVDEAIRYYSYQNEGQDDTLLISHPDKKTFDIFNVAFYPTDHTGGDRLEVAYRFAGDTQHCHASYILRSNGIDIIHSNTKTDGQAPIILAPSGTLRIYLPKSLMGLPDIRVSFIIWNEDFSRNMVWIRNIRVNSLADSNEPQLQFV
jgi:lipopolysaccharide transport system ATP-binding protein